MEKERLQLHLLYFLFWSMHGTNLDLLGLQTDIVKDIFHYINYLDSMSHLARTRKQFGIFLIPHSK